MNTLTALEQYYYNVMRSGNVLYLKAKTGTAKSSILRTLAKKINYQYIDLRLSTIDETDLTIPSLNKIDDDLTVINNAIPKWVLAANKKPTIIHFEELNRCRKEIQDAALGVLLERVVGGTFGCKLNDSPEILLCASGNIGLEDGCNVEDFDAAIKNRLIIVNHELSLEYWKNNFALENVHPIICDFLTACPDYFYRMDSNCEGAFATPRSWTFLSNYITTVYGKKSPSTEWKDDVSKNGFNFVGSSILKMMKWVEEVSIFSIEDILNNYNNVKKLIKESGRNKIDELILSLKSKNITELSLDQTKNLISFLKDIKENEDMVAGYLEYIITKSSLNDIQNNKNIKCILTDMRKYKKVITNAMGISE